jgi:[ribosomal protein S18]-alanine N-acetyltransferase
VNRLEIKPLTADQLPAAVELDRLCLGGLWTLDGYRRELDSPNSDLLILQGIGIREQGLGIGQQNLGIGNQGLAPEKTLIPIPRSAEHLDSETRRNRSQQSQPSFDKAHEPPTSNPQPPTPNSLLGLGCLWAIADEAHITLLLIHPDYRRQGLGQMLLIELLSSAWRRELKWATLEVRVSNQAAIALYQQFGFETAGRRKRYYQDNGEDALILWRRGLQHPEFSKTLQQWRRTAIDRLQQSKWKMGHDRHTIPS